MRRFFDKRAAIEYLRRNGAKVETLEQENPDGSVYATTTVTMENPGLKMLGAFDFIGRIVCHNGRVTSFWGRVS